MISSGSPNARTRRPTRLRNAVSRWPVLGLLAGTLATFITLYLRWRWQLLDALSGGLFLLLVGLSLCLVGEIGLGGLAVSARTKLRLRAVVIALALATTAGIRASWGWSDGLFALLMGTAIAIVVVLTAQIAAARVQWRSAAVRWRAAPARRALALSCAVLLLVDYGFYLQRVLLLRQVQRPTGSLARLDVDLETARLIGDFSNASARRFSLFNTRKAPGVVRVGCLGDSFTAGAEVAPELDYCTLLHGLFLEAGYDQVETLNFGAGWHGFHQTFMVWERVARHYELDYVLLGPAGFWYDRDTTFNHGGSISPYYLHARYVVKGDGVERVDVLGEDYEDRFAAYHRFLSPLRYLRYDRNAPPFLAALLPAGRTLPNPFYYYRGTMEQEALETYRALLGLLADGRQKTALAYYEKPIVDVARGLGRTNLTVLELDPNQQFPYRAPLNHNGPLGNLLVARQFFAALTGRSDPVSILDAVDLVTPVAEQIPNVPLHEYERVYVAFENSPTAVAFFGEPADTTAGFLAARGVKSLVGFKRPGESLVEAYFVPLPYEVTPELARRATVPVEPVTGVPGLWTLDVDIPYRSPWDPVLVVSAEAAARLRELRFVAGPVVRVQPDEDNLFRVVPMQGKWVRLTASGASLVDERRLGEHGRFELVLERGGEQFRVPVARWRRRPLAAPGPALSHPIGPPREAAAQRRRDSQ
jgi:hypothetical protein